MEQKPQHIAVIMDGNGRWATQRGLSRSKGHLAGVDAVRELVRGCRAEGIGYVTVYAFSKENWQRPQNEVGFLFELFLQFIRQELPELMAQDIRLNFIGDKRDLPFTVRQTLDYALRKTADNKSMVFTLAISYAGREEILEACRFGFLAEIGNGFSGFFDAAKTFDEIIHVINIEHRAAVDLIVVFFCKIAADHAVADRVEIRFAAKALPDHFVYAV